MKNSNIYAFITLILVTLNAFSQESTPDSLERGSFGINVNPAYFALGGYSVKGIYHLPKRWSFGVNVEGGFELTDDFRDVFFNDNENVEVDWDFLVAGEARYRVNQAAYDRGFYANATVGFEGWTVNEVGTSESNTFDNWFATLGIGYNWYPFRKKNFNVGLSYGAIFILNNTDDQLAGSTPFSIDTIIPPSLIPSTINIGWRF